ncbi:MAG: radical SAM protein [Sphingomonadaceae bacterium]
MSLVGCQQSTQAGIEKFIEARVSDLASLQLSWFGGEPLVAKDIVLRIASFAHRLCDVHGVSFSGGLTTNAYLLKKDLLEELLSFRQNFFQITLDGFGDIHDAVRKQAGGKGSFDRIWNNLLDARSVASHFSIQLRIHVRRDNVSTLPILMNELGRNFAKDKRFTLDFEHLRDLGGGGGKSVGLPLNRGEMQVIESECRAIYNEHTDADAEHVADGNSFNEVPSAASKFGTAIEGQYICYAAKANSLLVRSDGRIGKCTVALDDDRNTIGKIHADGSIELDNAKLRPWLRGLDSLDAASLACPLSRMAS